MKEIAVAVLNWNGEKLLEEFLPSVVKHSLEADVFLIDNNSSDSSISFVQEKYPSVKIIQTNANLGYAGGYNFALAEIKNPYVVLLNSDIETTENWLKAPLELLKSDESIGACQPKIKAYKEKDSFEYAGAAGGFIDYLGYPFCRGRLFENLEKDFGQYNDEREIFWASGACLFVNRNAFYEAGELDETCFAHMEEIDLCWRLKNMGYKIMFNPNSTVYHMGGFIIKYGSPGKVFRNHRNNLIMLLKNLPPYEGIWKIPLRFFMDLLTIFKMFADGNFNTIPSISRAHIQFLFYFPKWYAKRNAAKKLWNNPNLRGVYPKSMVWQFFVKGKEKFSDFNWKP